MDNSTDSECGDDTTLMLPHQSAAKMQRRRRRRERCSSNINHQKQSTALEDAKLHGVSDDDTDALPSYAAALAAAVVPTDPSLCTPDARSDGEGRASSSTNNNNAGDHGQHRCESEEGDDNNVADTVCTAESVSCNSDGDNDTLQVSQNLPQSSV